MLTRKFRNLLTKYKFKTTKRIIILWIEITYCIFIYFRASSEGSRMENQRRHKSVRWSWVKYPEQVVLDIRNSSVRSYCLCTANRLNFGRYYEKFWSRSMKTLFKSIVWFKYLKLFPELKCGSVFQKQLYCSIHENFQ